MKYKEKKKSKKEVKKNKKEYIENNSNSESKI